MKTTIINIKHLAPIHQIIQRTKSCWGKTLAFQRNFTSHDVVYNLCHLISNDKHHDNNKQRTRFRTDAQTSSLGYLGGEQTLLRDRKGEAEARRDPRRAAPSCRLASA